MEGGETLTHDGMYDLLEKVKNTHHEICRKRERAESVMDESDKYLVKVYASSITEKAAELDKIISALDRFLTSKLSASIE